MDRFLLFEPYHTFLLFCPQIQQHLNPIHPMHQQFLFYHRSQQEIVGEGAEKRYKRIEVVIAYLIWRGCEDYGHAIRTVVIAVSVVPVDAIDDTLNIM